MSSIPFVFRHSGEKGRAPSRAPFRAKPIMTDWRRIVVASIAVAMLSGCISIGSGKVLSLVGLEGRWSGPVRPSNPGCGAERHGLMRVGGGKFAFDPFGSTTIVNGDVEGDVLKGSLTKVGGSHRRLSITFEGHATPVAERAKVIEGILSSGNCVWQVVLARG